MTKPPAARPPALPRRDRVAILAALGGVTAIAWTYLVVLAADMEDMAGMADGSAMAVHAWTRLDFALMFAMWAVMMVGMMVPSAAPMTLLYGAVARKAASQGAPVAPTAAFVAGYVAMWTAFSAGATLAQWALQRGALLSPAMVTTSPFLGASLLGAAGVWQLTPWKEACLRHCRAPARFMAEHWRPGTAGAFRMGLVHGAWCLGCCWALMGLLFFGGVMNLLWIAAITAFVLGEKVLPFGRAGGRVVGVAAIAVALALALGWTLPG